jgi:hypothetical protein
MDKESVVYTMEYYLVIKRKEILVADILIAWTYTIFDLFIS